MEVHIRQVLSQSSREDAPGTCISVLFTRIVDRINSPSFGAENLVGRMLVPKISRFRLWQWICETQYRAVQFLTKFWYHSHKSYFWHFFSLFCILNSMESSEGMLWWLSHMLFRSMWIEGLVMLQSEHFCHIWYSFDTLNTILPVWSKNNRIVNHLFHQGGQIFYCNSLKMFCWPNTFFITFKMLFGQPKGTVQTRKREKEIYLEWGLDSDSSKKNMSRLKKQNILDLSLVGRSSYA